MSNVAPGCMKGLLFIPTARLHYLSTHQVTCQGFACFCKPKQSSSDAAFAARTYAGQLKGLLLPSMFFGQNYVGSSTVRSLAKRLTARQWKFYDKWNF